jgi:steroid 5-alpha reductase family enzyme
VPDFSIYLSALPWLIAGMSLVWALSLVLADASIIDPVWPVAFLGASLVYLQPQGGLDWAELSARQGFVLGSVALWTLRLCGYLTWRKWGEPEDRRYTAMRAGQPRFWIRSLFMIFWLQATLAWVISLPLFGALAAPGPAWGLLDSLAALVFAVGFLFEALGDLQLLRFKHAPENRGQVMDRGLWRYTRHPNYFGNFCMNWAWYLSACAVGAWWSLPGPLLISFLLLKVSGVAMLEKDIGERRPAYAEYIRRTNAFFPGPRRA